VKPTKVIATMRFVGKPLNVPTRWEGLAFVELNEDVLVSGEPTNVLEDAIQNSLVLTEWLSRQPFRPAMGQKIRNLQKPSILVGGIAEFFLKLFVSTKLHTKIGPDFKRQALLKIGSNDQNVTKPFQNRRLEN
jgi:hypothetical protein